MNGNEEHISWQQMHPRPEPPREHAVEPELVPEPEPIPVAETAPLEEVPDIYELMPLEEVEPAPAVPVELLHSAVPVRASPAEPMLALPVRPPRAVVPRARHGWTIAAWVTIVAVVGFISFTNHVFPMLKAAWDTHFGAPLPPRPQAGNDRGAPGIGPGADDVGEEGGDADFAFVFESRYLVGWNSLWKDRRFADTAKSLDRGPPARRLRAITVTGEVDGPNEALQQLGALEREASLAAPERELAQLLRRLYGDFQQRRFHAPSLTSAERARLVSDLGWYGELALHPEGSFDPDARAAAISPARRTAIITLSGLLTLIGLTGIGLVLLVIFAICMLVGWLRLRFGRHGPYAGVYAETFALWMVLFVVMMVTFGVLDSCGLPKEIERNRLLITGIVELCTALLIFYPVLRGVPWGEVRRDLGLHFGRRPLVEPFYGLGCYVMSLPLLAAGAVITFILMLFFGQLPGFGGAELFSADREGQHPAFELAAKGGWWIKAQVVFVAVIVAPIIEELMFRGVLYRHLRDLSGKLGFFASVMLSGIASCTIFAVIHPQNPLAFPVLMGLAFGIGLTREWRGSLVPCMIMHALHNGLVSLVFLTIASMRDGSVASWFY